MTEAAKATGQDRGQHYEWLKDPQYRAAFEAAKLEAAELLEDEAIRRAFAGTTKPIYYQGAKCGEEIVYSDGLMQFLLRGTLPTKYRQTAALEVTGKNGAPIELGIVERLNAGRARVAALAAAAQQEKPA